MIISKTPFRLSICGGSTDLPSWAKRHSGLVLGGAIDKFSYLTVRDYPQFHEHKSRVVYNQIELVNSWDELQHRAIRAAIESLGMTDRNLEITHIADLPNRSGIGSSSTFVVGLLNALSALKGDYLPPHELATRAIEIEQVRLNESVGCQDQTLSAFGGLNILKIRKTGEIDVLPLGLSPAHQDELESHLMCFYTRLQRTSSEVSSSYSGTIDQKEREQWALMRLTEQAIESIQKKSWEKLGWCIDQNWRLKHSLSSKVSNKQIDEMYAHARVCGALGGKLSGAGGGGMLFLVCRPEKREKIKKVLEEKFNCLEVPFRFEPNGSRIIFHDSTARYS